MPVLWQFQKESEAFLSKSLDIKILQRIPYRLFPQWNGKKHTKECQREAPQSQRPKVERDMFTVWFVAD